MTTWGTIVRSVVKTQWVAGLLAIWSLITGFAVHLVAGVSAADAMVAYDYMTHFYKNLAMAGGFLFVLVYGAGQLSIDGRFRVAAQTSGHTQSSTSWSNGVTTYTNIYRGDGRITMCLTHQVGGIVHTTCEP